MVFLLLVAHIQIEEAVIADQLCRSSRLRLTLGESSAIQTKLPANALQTDPKKIILITFVFGKKDLIKKLDRLNSPYVDKIICANFHAFCARLDRFHASFACGSPGDEEGEQGGGP